MSEIVDQFIKTVYPEMTELAMTANTEETCLKDATDLINRLQERVRELEDKLFTYGEMKKAPCFVCGYSGPNYYQPDTHPCAARHHALFKEPQFPVLECVGTEYEILAEIRHKEEKS